MTTLQQYRPGNWRNPLGWISDGIVALLVMSWWKRLVCLATGAVALMVIVSLASHSSHGWSLRFWGSGDLPVSAAERAPLFAQAWAAGDREAMSQFVLPAEKAKLQAWVAANPIPVSIAGSPASDRETKTVSVQKDDLDGAVVKVQFSSLSPASADPKASVAYIQRQNWTFSGGHWFFSPLASTSAVAAQKTLASSTSTGRQPSKLAEAYNTAPPQSYSRASDRPASAPTSRNVVIPSTVPPWARVR